MMDRFSIGHEFPVHFLKEVKVTTDQYFLLVELTHTQLWLVVVFKFSPIRAQEMGIHVLYYICPCSHVLSFVKHKPYGKFELFLQNTLQFVTKLDLGSH